MFLACLKNKYWYSVEELGFVDSRSDDSINYLFLSDRTNFSKLGFAFAVELTNLNSLGFV
ncbi:Uncharacterised protein [Legionella sainthelensi]|nr:Uncharacterised protein [Legionella sainthelensi]